MNSITTKLVKLQLHFLEERENESNPCCPDCGLRDNIENFWPIIHNNIAAYVCAECADDNTQRISGCRFDEENCLHEDCKEPPKEFGLKKTFSVTLDSNLRIKIIRDK